MVFKLAVNRMKAEYETAAQRPQVRNVPKQIVRRRFKATAHFYEGDCELNTGLIEMEMNG